MPGHLLRVVTAGSVDDGKSTLVGRLLHDAKVVLGDQLAAVHRDSARRGHANADLALLVDGLRAEREQGITIDVAYRYFATGRRSFVLADTPGHVQYTRNMVTGASTADVAVILVDARTGVIEQTRRHLAVAALLAVPELVLAVNKMDLVDYAEPVFDRIVADFAAVAGKLGLTRFTPIPLVALTGENVVDRAPAMPWYAGPSLLGCLEQFQPAAAGSTPARFPVQLVIRPQTAEHRDYRGYGGRIDAGVLRPGDPVRVLPSGLSSTVLAIDGAGQALAEAGARRSVTVRLVDELDIARGDVIVADVEPQPVVRRELTADVCWLTDRSTQAGDRYRLRHGTRDVLAVVAEVVDRLDLDTVTRTPAERLGLNDIGLVRLRLAEPVVADSYAQNRSTGSFLLVAADSGATAAAGMIR